MNNYFNKTGSQQELQSQQEPVVEVTEETRKIPSLIRTPETGDKVFLVRDGVAHWIMNPEVFDALNAKWENIVAINREKFKLLAMGERITPENVEKYKFEKVETVPAVPTPVPPAEEFKTYDDTIVHTRVKGLTSVVIILSPSQYEVLSQLKITHTTQNEVILVINGERVLKQNDPRFAFANKVVLVETELPLDDAMDIGMRISTGEWIMRVDLYHVKE